MRAVLLLLLSANVVCAASAKLTFIKEFPGSSPAYVLLSVARDGALSYAEAANDPQPITAHLSSPETDALFAMADKLNHFGAPLESGLKVANTGKKTFRYEDENSKATQQIFNYSLDETARQLLDRFEQIAASERAYINLDRSVHFDKLGVNDALAEIESLWLRKQLSAPDQFVPLLTRVANHETFMHLARDRAARLKDQFTTPALVAQ